MASGTRAQWAARSGIALTVTALAVGISVGASPDTPLGPPSAAATGRLDPFADCDEVAAWYAKRALPEVTAWGLSGWGYHYLRADASMLAESAGTDVPTVGNGPTGTNVQEAGVDEPDTAKIMGDYVVSLRSHDLVVTDVSGADPVEVSRLRLPSSLWGSELLISGDRAIVMSTAATYGPIVSDDIGVDPVAFPDIWPGGGSASRTYLITVDLSDPAAPTVLNKDVIDGQITTAREHDGTIRVVTTSAPQLDFVYPTKNLSSREALAQNRAIVRNADGQDWLPQRGTDANGEDGENLLGCSDVNHPEAGAGLGTVTVLTLDLDDPAGLVATAVSADGSLVYASADRLYVATVDGGWGLWSSAEGDADSTRHPDTEIHAFATEGSTTTYTASGQVEGVAPDRWAFSEYEGLLRVATARGESWQPTDNAVTVLEERDDQLVPVGSVGGLGKNEQIQAVRWFGDLAVVVTFQQIDPLYTLDLSDPTALRVIGELKAPGFSSYLHPLGGNLLLGVGQAATPSGLTTGAQVSVFDLTGPELIDRVSLGRHSWTPVQDDSRAFTYLPEQRIALVPTTAWGRATTGIQVVEVAADGTLNLDRTVAVPGWTGSLRTLPVGGDRVALVDDGNVVQILDLG